MNIMFSVEETTIHNINFIFNKFSNAVPVHSHGSNCYEIHYISNGYEITPALICKGDSLFVHLNHSFSNKFNGLTKKQYHKYRYNSHFATKQKTDCNC